MKITTRLLLLIFISILSFTSVNAQDNREISSPNVTEEVYDPISALLDSLVTLTHVVRYNQQDANCFDPNAVVPGSVPTFSDEVYAQRISEILSPIPMSYNEHVKGFIDLYAVRKRGLTQRAMGLSNLYFPMFEEILDREGLPLEFKYLSVVESALNPIAVSRVGATGIWQFMYNTGIMYDLKVNSYTDERRDPLKATFAACQYFKDMYKIYEDWLLVIAAYNCGAGNVNKAIKRSGGKKNFWEIMHYLPAETRSYVPAFIAVAYVMNYSREHNLYPVSPAYSYFEVDTITVSNAINFKVLSNTLDLPVDVISFLNPIYKKNIIPDVGSDYILRLPTNKMAIFMSSQESIMAQSLPPARPVMPVYAGRRSSRDAADEGSTAYETITKRVKKVHTVRRGENLGVIAGKYDMSVQQVKKMNRLKSSTLRSGQKLSVYAYVKTKVPVKSAPAVEVAVKKDTDAHDSANVNRAINGEESADQQSQAQVSADTDDNERVVETSPRYIYHVVQPGDTLWNIAKRYEGVTVEMIKDINNLNNATLKLGTKLKVIVNS
ncbi:MAG: LysM peptidoglycan-binding domain-containing protein [Bacteroidetes bacterium]|nr:LysM peptidoglycan-binding domain-containing protein [Bacteroidota bacterium]